MEEQVLQYTHKHTHTHTPSPFPKAPPPPPPPLSDVLKCGSAGQSQWSCYRRSLVVSLGHSPLSVLTEDF